MDGHKHTILDSDWQECAPKRLSATVRAIMRSQYVRLREKEIATWDEIEALESQIRNKADLLLVVGNTRSFVSEVLTAGDTGWTG